MQRFELEATYLTLTSNLVNAALTEAALRAQIDATHAIIDDQTRTLASFRRQLVLGQVAEADIAAQEAQLAQAETILPPL
jgi:outer membrane protein TolC